MACGRLADFGNLLWSFNFVLFYIYIKTFYLFIMHYYDYFTLYFIYLFFFCTVHNKHINKLVRVRIPLSINYYL